MKRHLFIIVFVLCAISAFAENTEVAGMRINRRMMEDKTLIGFQANAMLPAGAYAKDVNGTLGGGVRGKYFGTNTFAFAFDFGFFAPNAASKQIAVITDSLTRALKDEQRKEDFHFPGPDTLWITSVDAHSQYIPINLSVEFYLPSHALKNFRPYAGIGIGLNMINRRYKAVYSIEKSQEILRFEEKYQLSSNRGCMSINPSIGFLATIDELWNINVDLRYNHLLGEQKGGAFCLSVGVVLDLSFKYVR